MKILSQNMWLTSLTLRTPPEKANRIDGFVKNLRSYNEQHDPIDIVCLQELFTFGGIGFLGLENESIRLKRRLLEPCTEELGYNYVQSNSASLFCQDSGLAILTRHKILKSENYIFQYASYTEYVVAKGILYALIKEESTSSHVFVFCLHMDAHSGKARREQLKETKLFVQSKLKQAEEDGIVVTPGGSNRVVICGDFNIDSLHDGGSTYGFMVDQFNGIKNGIEMDNVLGKDVTKHPVTFPIPTFNDWCLDHIFISKLTNDHLSYQVMKWECMSSKGTSIGISDHYGVLANINSTTPFNTQFQN